jgi:putative membrane fusion protein
MNRDMSNPKLVRQRRLPANKLRKGIVGLLLFLSLTFFFWGRIVAGVSNVQFLDRQEIAQTVPLEGILFKHEYVLRAPVGGKLQLAAADGDRLKAGAKAAQVLAVQQDAGGESYDVTTSVAGICCTHLDGLEQVLSPDSIDVLVVPKIEKIDDRSTSEGVRVEKGQPVLKIIDNLRPVYIYAEMPKSYFPDLTADKPARWKAAWGGYELSVKTITVADKGDWWEGYLMVTSYPDQLLHQRNIQFSLTARTLEGFLVPRRAVVYREGQPGIFLSVLKKASWTPVTIEGELEGMMAVSGPELAEDSRYVNNPLLAREGRRVE